VRSKTHAFAVTNKGLTAYDPSTEKATLVVVATSRSTSTARSMTSSFTSGGTDARRRADGCDDVVKDARFEGATRA
jgi:hypothetical protein